MKISDQLVQMFKEDEYDNTVLQKAAYPVNLRLYVLNPGYRRVILAAVLAMDEHLRSVFEDYPAPRSVSAPNLGFPFCIIGYVRRQTTPSSQRTNENQFFLNPKLTYNGTKIPSNSNCGSLRLPEPVSVLRHSSIDITYYDLEANKHTWPNIYRHDGGFSIQNAYDQMNGITILDRHAQDEKDKTK
jgi:peptide deformylase